MPTDTEATKLWNAIEAIRNAETSAPTWVQAFKCIVTIAAIDGDASIQRRARDFLYDNFNVIITPGAANDGARSRADCAGGGAA